MSFPISKNKCLDLQRFNSKFGILPIESTERRISIFPHDHYSIQFTDSEQYVHIIKCELKFNAEVSFFIEDVAKAIEGDFAENRFVKNNTEGNPVKEILWSDDYLDRVLLFFSEKADILLSPEKWFKKAVELSNRSLVQKFPELSEEYLKINSDYFEANFR